MKRLRALKTAWERRRYGSSNYELRSFWSTVGIACMFQNFSWDGQHNDAEILFGTAEDWRW